MQVVQNDGLGPGARQTHNLALWMLHCGLLLSTSERGLKSRYAIPIMNVAPWDATKDP